MLLGKLYASFGDVHRRVLLATDDTGWIEPSLTNGWENYDAATAYRKDASGVVHIKGTVRYGALNYAIFQLRDGFRPTRDIRKAVPMRDGGIGLLDINTQGYVIPRGDEEEAYDENGDPTGEIIEVGYLSLEMSFL